MSFIQQIYECLECQCQFNVALGTFGYGMPQECPNCGEKGFKLVKDGWDNKLK